MNKKISLKEYFNRSEEKKEIRILTCIECGEQFEELGIELFEYQSSYCSPTCHADSQGYGGNSL